LSGDTTVVVPVTGHLDVSFLSPACAPRVLHQPVVFKSLGTIAHNQYTVVKSGLTAQQLVINTRLVHLEGLVGGIDGNGDWTNGCNSLFESIFILGSDVDVSANSSPSQDLYELAQTILSFVGIFAFKFNTA